MPELREEKRILDRVREYERSTNRVVGNISLGLALITILTQVILRLKIQDSVSVINTNRYVFVPLSAVMIACYLFSAAKKFDAPWIKYLLMSGIVLLTSGQFFVYTIYAAYFVLLPIVISVRYFNRKFIAEVAGVTFLLFTVSCVLNLTAGKTWGFLALAHASNVFDLWESPLFAVTYLILPLGLTAIFSAIYCIGTTRSGHRILENEVQSVCRVITVETELKTAAGIQQSALPPASFTTPDGHLTLEACERPAKEVGGDFYDWFMVNEHTLGVLVADVSDKGVGAALFMMSSKKALRCAVECCPDLKTAAAFAARSIAENNESTMFLTMWLCLIDTETGIGKYINAGHPFPMVRSATGEVHYLANEPNMFLGGFAEAVPTVHRFTLEEGDTLLLYTDGITDAMNPEGESFGAAGAEKALAAAGPTAREAVEQTLTAADAFASGQPQFDDMTLLALRCNGKKPLTERIFEYTSGPEATERIVDGVNALLGGFSCPDKRRREADVIMDELCTNIADYAYGGKSGRISVRAEVGSNFLRLTFTDDGLAFNPLSRPDPVLGGEPSIGGLGIFLVKNMSDGVSYRRVGNSNELTVEMIWGF